MSENLSILDELKESIEEEYGGESKEVETPSFDEEETQAKKPAAEEETVEPEEEELSAQEEESDPGYEDEKEGEQKPKKAPGPIPYERFKEVVDQRREFKESQERLQSETAELRGQLTELLRSREQKPPPDPNEDPDAYIAHIHKEHERLRNEYEKVTSKQKESDTQQQQAQRVNEYAQERVQEFMTEQPDYPLAYSHLQSAIIQERMELGDSVQGAQQYFNEVAGSELNRLYQTKGDPARYVYNMAKRYGYKPPNGEASEEKEAEAPKPKRKPVDKEKAQKASRSVATKGKAAETDLEEIDIDQMSHKQFMEFVARQKKAEGGQQDLF